MEKTGWKTTEGWITAIVSYLTTDMFTSSSDRYVQMVSLAVGGLVAAVYIWSRTKIKAERVSVPTENQ